MSKARKLKSGAWNVRVTIDGHTYSFTDPTKKEATRKAAVFAAEHAEAVSNPTLIDAVTAYIDKGATTLSPSTIRGYRSIERTLRKKYPSICQKRLTGLTDSDMQVILEGKSKKTAKNYIGLLQPATGLKFDVMLPKGKNKDVRIPSDLEVLGLLAIFRDTEVEIPVMLGAFGGLRRGEICALTIRDFSGDYVRISKDKVMDEYGCYVVKDPKTETSNRSVLLPHFVVQAVRDKGYITNLTPHQLSNKFQKKQLALGINPPYSFHALRHYSASYLHAQGIPDAYIMKRGGWATPSVMQRVYRHALEDHMLKMEQDAVSAFQFPFQD